MKPTSLNCIPNSVQIDWKLGEIIGAEILRSRTPVILNEGQGHLD